MDASHRLGASHRGTHGGEFGGAHSAPPGPWGWGVPSLTQPRWMAVPLGCRQPHGRGANPHPPSRSALPARLPAPLPARLPACLPARLTRELSKFASMKVNSFI